MPHTPHHEMRERYQRHAKAMSEAMREAGAHIEANSQLGLSEEELVQAIGSIIVMLKTAEYHADRMKVYAALMHSGPRTAIAKTR
jgi:hypothetical protein